MSSTIKWVLAIVSVLLLCGLFAAGYVIGYRIATGKCQGDKLTSVSRAIDQANQTAAVDAQFFQPRAEKRAMQRRQEIKSTVEAVRHVANHPDLYGQRLDARGLCLIRSAAAGDNRVCPAGSDGPSGTNNGTGANGGRSAH